MSGLNNEKNNKGIKELKEESNFEARQNLFGFFSLLLEIDKRINPHLYKKAKNNENNGNSNNTNKT